MRKNSDLISDTIAKNVSDGTAPLNAGRRQPEQGPLSERYLKDLGFPDGRALLALRPQENAHPKDAVQSAYWDYTRPNGVRFAPTLKPDDRDWSPLTIKQNYGVWSQRTACEYGLRDLGRSSQDPDGRQNLNAFRHGTTAAIFAIKYGPKTSLLLGLANEMFTKLASACQGRLNESELADTNADLLNNRVGIDIATNLIAQRGKDSLSVRDVTDAVIDAIKTGRLITQPLKAWRNKNIAPEIGLLDERLHDFR
jgi:hypothetical protein